MPSTPSDPPPQDSDASGTPPSEPTTTTPDELRRLHPASLLFSVGSAARGLLVPGIAVLLFGGGERVHIFLMILFLPAAFFAIVRYFTFKYRLSNEELILQHGVLTRNERHVPFSRIQNIDLVQNPLHRVLGVATVRIETASGSDAEANLQVLSLSAVQQMRERVFADRGAALPETPKVDPVAETSAATVEVSATTAQPSAGVPVFRLTLSEVLLLGAISARGLAMVGALLGFAWQFDVWEKIGDRWESVVGRLSESASLTGGQQAALIAVGSVLAFLLFQMLSVAWGLVRFYGFELARHGEDLRSHCGLFTRVSGTLPRHRIQVLTITQTPPMRWLARVSVRVRTAGAQNEGGTGSSRQWVAPLIERARLGALLGEVQPELDPASIQWEPVHPRTARRLRRKWLIFSALLALAAGLFLPRWAISAPVIILVLGWIGVGLDVRARAHAQTGSLLLYRSGWWIRRIVAVRHSKIQTVTLHTSPFDRRWKMATVAVDTAGGGGGSGESVALPYLEPSVAEELRASLTRRAASIDFRW